jgi:transcriptional regulator with XRE-family HTH domain
MELHERIYQARTKAKLTQSELAEAVGKTRGAVAQWERGEIRPRHSALEDIASATGQSLDWLLRGKEPPSTLQVVGEVAGGLWREASLEFESFGVPVAPHPAYPAEVQRLYRVTGNSVNRIVQDGDYIHCVSVDDGGLRPEDGDLVVVRRMEHGLSEYTAKRLRVESGRKALLPESTDPNWQTEIPLNGNDGTDIQITDIIIAKWSPIPRGRRGL